MTMIGKNITAFNDSLLKISENDLFEQISNSSIDLKNRIDQLRNIAIIDVKKYRQMKTLLPYITCGTFNPAIRKTENFASISSFIIDIDHLSEKEMTVDTIKFNLGLDNNILMAFTSPSGNGLKVMFRLNEKCYDHAQFSIFYKLFLKNFSNQYGLNQVVDHKTSDVTRACFLSHDPHCYYNPDAEPVNMKSYVNFSSTLEVREIQEQLSLYEKEINQVQTHEQAENELSPDVLHLIKQKLNPKIRTQKQKLIYVPEELDKIMTKLTSKLNSYDIEVKTIEDINYGKKFVLMLQSHWAEVNVFWGKKGFSVVKTPKRGSNEELADIGFKLLCEELI